MEGGWHAIPVQNLITGWFFDVLAEAPLRLVGETCAVMKPWDANGWSIISYVEMDGAAQEKLIPVFERKRFLGTSQLAAAARRGRAERGTDASAMSA